MKKIELDNVKARVKKVANNVGDAAKEISNKAEEAIVKAVDQNDNGELDKEDFAIIKEKTEEKVKETAKEIKQKADTKMEEHELKVLAPVFWEDLYPEEIKLPRFIRVAEIDKKHAQSPLCENAIGHSTEVKGLSMLTIYSDKLDKFGITLYPTADEELYYVDPMDHKRYIALNEYFDYIKKVQINEMERIAQDLGAKHFKISFLEKKASFTKKKAKGNLTIAKKGATVTQSKDEEQYTSFGTAKDMKFPGHEPLQPTLKYLKQDPDIQTLISVRMNEASPVERYKTRVEVSKTMGMKETDAIKMDAIIKKDKIAAGASIAEEVRKESRLVLDYLLEF